VLIDCLITPGTMWKGRRLIEAVHEGATKAGLDSRIVTSGKPRSDAYVVLYGLGGSDRIQYAGQPNVISFDAGYWERKLDLETRKYRVSIGGFHCPDRIFRGPNPGPDRWNESGLTIAENGGDPNGPILLVGNGPKSNRIGAADWCAEMSRNLREWFPGRTIWYRPKPRRAHDQGVDYDALAEGKDIDKVLSQCSLVICRHSNVAVDCARVGVPCWCEDGAAAAIYSSPSAQVLSGIRDGFFMYPSGEGREEFLHRLAWWQWSAGEIRGGKFWPWMIEELAR
jgi:hypothetical protein